MLRKPFHNGLALEFKKKPKILKTFHPKAGKIIDVGNKKTLIYDFF